MTLTHNVGHSQENFRNTLKTKTFLGGLEGGFRFRKSCKESSYMPTSPNFSNVTFYLTRVRLSNLRNQQEKVCRKRWVTSLRTRPRRPSSFSAKQVMARSHAASLKRWWEPWLRNLQHWGARGPGEPQEFCDECEGARLHTHPACPADCGQESRPGSSEGDVEGLGWSARNGTAGAGVAAQW